MVHHETSNAGVLGSSRIACPSPTPVNRREKEESEDLHLQKFHDDPMCVSANVPSFNSEKDGGSFSMFCDEVGVKDTSSKLLGYI